MKNKRKFHVTDCLGKTVKSFKTEKERDSFFDKMRKDGHQVGFHDGELKEEGK